MQSRYRSGSAYHAGHPEISAEMLGVFKFDFGNTLPSDDVYRPVQISQERRFQMGRNYYEKD